jgi:endonuclease/exonuclease/phosphatase family metal-dependent hydrolase
VHPKFQVYFRDVLRSKWGRSPATFSWGPLRFRLDYIYISDALQSIDAYAVKNPITRIASDHLPVVAILGITA